MSRRTSIAIALAALLSGVPGAALAQDAKPPAVSEAAEKAIRAGLDHLAKAQKEDGRFDALIGRKVNAAVEGVKGRSVATTAVAGLAFLAGGSTPGKGPHGANLDRAVTWILAQSRDDGFLVADGSNVYGHAFATLFLAEVAAAGAGERVKPALAKAVAFLAKAQNDKGGWRYLPGAEDADISVTSTCVVALARARDAGVEVPAPTMERAIAYVKGSWVGDDYPNPRYRGLFWYQVIDRPFTSSRLSFALTAAAVDALANADAPDSKECRGGLRALVDPAWRPPVWRLKNSFDYFYGHFHAARALRRSGGETWAGWYPDVAAEVLSGQREDGSWEDLVGREHATAMAVLILASARRPE